MRTGQRQDQPDMLVVNRIENLLPVPPGPDDLRLPENPELMGNRGHTHAYNSGNVTYHNSAGSNDVHYGQPRRIPEIPEKRGNILPQFHRGKSVQCCLDRVFVNTGNLAGIGVVFRRGSTPSATKIVETATNFFVFSLLNILEYMFNCSVCQ